MQNVVVVDFGTGNLRSVHKAIEHAADGVNVTVTRDPAIIRAADRVVLPGQGAMGTWVQAMQQFGLTDAIHDALATKPVLGICLGLQALTRRSEEDNGVQGLGYFQGEVKKFPAGGMDGGAAAKIPHMGWKRVPDSMPSQSGCDWDCSTRFQPM